MSEARAILAAFGSAMESHDLDHLKGVLHSKEGRGKNYSVVGRTPPIPKQKRNKPCGCGSGNKAKKCCGNYPQPRRES